jgi:hypothetical protein
MRSRSTHQTCDGQTDENSKKVEPGCDISKEHVIRVSWILAKISCRFCTMRASRTTKLYSLFDSATRVSLIWKISHNFGKGNFESEPHT